jgi:hypothetical protein
MERREFIRHPAEIPLEVLDVLDGDQAGGEAPLRISNVGQGGLCFVAGRPFERGRQVRVRIRFVHPPFEAEAVVVRCRPLDQGWEIGVRFLDAADAFRARMVEQVCHIERYRREVREREGRALDGAEAAREWIDRYAAEFPEA